MLRSVKKKPFLSNSSINVSPLLSWSSKCLQILASVCHKPRCLFKNSVFNLYLGTLQLKSMDYHGSIDILSSHLCKLQTYY